MAMIVILIKVSKYIKEKACFVSMDYSFDINNVKSYENELQDGAHINVKNSRIDCPEVLFNPK